jgi:hypothetical protein
VGAVAVLVLPAVALHGPWRLRFDQAWIRVILLAPAGVLGGLILPPQAGSRSFRALVGLQAAAAAVLLGAPLEASSSYPFSLDWSEGNRIWASSLVYITGRYPGLTPELYPDYASPAFFILQGLPFLLPGVTIRFVRVWTALLLVLPSLVLAGSVFLGRNRWPSGALRWSLVLWAFLFVMQGPAYAPPVLGAMAVVVACRARQPGWGMPATLLAGFFVGISRWTWLLAPAVWSSTWALLDPSIEESVRWRRALVLAASGVSGAALSLGWTGWVAHRPLFPYLTSLRHVILKYRLLPNATSALGIAPWIALVSAPAVILILWRWKRGGLWGRRMIPLAVGAGACLLFAIGLVASVKIGAGDNLHHFDMFLIDLVLIAGAMLAGGDDGVILVQGSGRLAPLAAVVLLAPVVSVVALNPAPLSPSDDIARASLERVQEAVAEAAERGPVLFIDQRQLLTFGLVPGASEVWDYELLDLMDRAMADDRDYLARFQEDLASRRFSLIVVNPLPIVWWDRASRFGEENDAWVRNVSVPILQHYRPVAELDAVGVWLLEPGREDPAE